MSDKTLVYKRWDGKYIEIDLSEKKTVNTSFNIFSIECSHIPALSYKCMTRVSKKLDIWIEFVVYVVNASDVIRGVWRNFELAPEIADIHRSAGIVVQIFVPYKVLRRKITGFRFGPYGVF